MQQGWREALGVKPGKPHWKLLQKAGLGNPRHSTMSSKKGIGKAIKKISYGKKKK